MSRPPTRVNGRVTKEYAAFAAMRARCQQTCASWKSRYEGTPYENMPIQPEWQTVSGYEDFYAYMGPAPAGTLLDRIENDKGYVKGNLRWATTSKSNQNKSNARLITAFGKTLHLSEWSQLTGLSKQAISRRLDVHGYTQEAAVTKKKS